MVNRTFDNIASKCASVDFTETSPTLDLSHVDFFRPFHLVYVGMFLRYHNTGGRPIKLILPRGSDAAKYLSRQNFWERFNLNPESIPERLLQRKLTGTSLNDIIDLQRSPTIAEDIASNVTDVLSRNRHTTLRVDYRIAELLSELVDNFAQHSGRALGVFAMQWYPQRHEIVLAIGDCGVGIRSRLSSSAKYSYLRGSSHQEAGLKAFDPLVSSKSEGGMGLTEVRDGVLELGGCLLLTTGDGYVMMDELGTREGEMSYDLPGVQIELSFPERR